MAKLARCRVTSMILAVALPGIALAVAACTDSSNPVPEAADASHEAGASGADATIDRATPSDVDAGGLLDGGGEPDAADVLDSGDGGDAADASDAMLAPDVDQNCADYASPPSPSGVNVKITNTTGAPLYLGLPAPSCDRGIGFTLTDATSNVLATWQPTSELTCAQLQLQCPGAKICDALFVTKLAPAATWSTGWPATIFVREPMPPKCYADAGCSAATCLHERTAPAGTLTVTATVYSAPLCGDAGAACGDCTVGASGDCTVPGATLVGGTPHSASATWSAGQGVVQLDVK